MSKSDNEIIPTFKSFQGLSISDISVIFQVSMQTSLDWSRGRTADPKAEAAALALNEIMERWKKESGSFNDVDHQHLMKRCEKLEEENKRLKRKVMTMSSAGTRSLSELCLLHGRLPNLPGDALHE